MMTETDYLQLIEDYKTLSHQDKYDKLLVYLHAAQKSEENLIGLYLLVDSLGVENIDDNSLVELYDAFVSLVEYDDSAKLHQAEHTISVLQKLKEKEMQEKLEDENDISNMLNDI